MNIHELTQLYPLLTSAESKVLWILQYSKIHGSIVKHQKKTGWVQSYEIREKLSALGTKTDSVGQRLREER